MKAKGMVQRPHKSKIAHDKRQKVSGAKWDKRGDKKR